MIKSLVKTSVFALALQSLGCGTSEEDSDEAEATSLGTFAVTAKLTSSDCGSEVSGSESYDFEVELLADDTALYWVEGEASLVGTIDDEDAEWNYHESSAVDAACTIQLDDLITATLNDASAPTKLNGTFEYTYSATSGSECSAQTIAGGGSFENLPCSIRYTFSGTKN